MTGMWRDDVRYAVRGARRRIWISAAVIATMAVGIGCATAVLSVVEGVLLREVPYDRPDRILWLNTIDTRGGGLDGLANPYDVRDWNARAHSFTAIVPYSTAGATVELASGPMRIDNKYVGPGLDRVLGIRAAYGRLFMDADYAPGMNSVVVSNALWRDHLNADPSIVGRSIRVNGSARTVIGVLPETRMPFPGEAVGIWSVLRPPTDEAGMNRSGVWLRVVARLRDGVSAQQARDEMAAIAKSLRAANPATNAGRDVRLSSLRDGITHATKPVILLLMAAVAIVLLIAGANIGSLLLAKAQDRQREFAIRAALGSGVANVTRMILAESAVLGIAGGVVGVALSPMILRALIALYPNGLPRAAEIHIDIPVLATALCAILAAIVAAGLPSLLQVRRLDLQQTLRSSERGLTGNAQRRVRAGLVVLQIALSVTMLIGGGILLRTFITLSKTDPGFAPSQLLSFNVAVPAARYPTMTQEVGLYNSLLERIRQIPGVHAAGASSLLPLANTNFIDGFHRDGYVDQLPNLPEARLENVTPGFIEALGLRVIAGRTLDARDREGAPSVAVVSEALAKKYFPNGAVGRHIHFHETPMEVVGVVSDKRHESLREDVFPELYVSRAQTDNPRFSAWFIVRSDRSDTDLVPAVRGILKDLDPGVALAKVSTMDARIRETLAPDRFRATLVGVLGILAVILATLGIYSLIAYTVAQQTREIGIRIALGATPHMTMRSVLQGTLTLALIGIAAGLVVALAGAKMLEGFVVGVTTRDPLTLVVVPIMFLVIATLAAAGPARRAARVDPLTALRSE